MKIALISSDPGTNYGGTEVLMDALAERLTVLGYQVDKKFHQSSLRNRDEILSTINEVRNLDLSEYNMVIAFRFPSYLVNHPNKLIWLLHQFRPLMDNYATEFGFPMSEPNDSLRKQLTRLDHDVFSKAGNKLRVNSQITLGRITDSVGVSSKILMCPLSQNIGEVATHTRPPEVDFDNFIFAGGRIAPDKRQHLAVLAAIESGTNLVIGGNPDNNFYVDELLKYENARHVRVIPRRLSVSELGWLYSNCSAVFYAPKNEDSYGFVAGEACFFGAELITCLDSGDVVGLARIMASGIAHPNYFDISTYFGKYRSTPDIKRRTEIRTKWKLFATGWEDVELWITQHLS